MYILFGNEILDSNDIINLINKDSDFKVETDLTKSTKREDVIALKININIKNIDLNLKFNQYDDIVFEKYLNKAEEIFMNFSNEKFDYTKRIVVNAYKWDELSNSIYLIVALSDISLPLLKLNDVLGRLLKQND